MTAVQAFHAWCLSACVCARVSCQCSGLGSLGISPPPDGARDIPGVQIYSPAAAEAWHSLFRLLFLAWRLLGREAGGTCPVHLEHFFLRNSFPEMAYHAFDALCLRKSDSRPTMGQQIGKYLHSHYVCFIYFVILVMGRERNKTVGGNERGIVLGGRGDADGCKLDWWGEDRARVVSKWDASPSPTSISRHPPSALPRTLYPCGYTPSLRSPWEQERLLSALEFCLLATEPTC